MRFFLLPLIFVSLAFSSPLQKAIDKALPYSTIKLQTGTYEGDLFIDKPLTLEGIGKNIIIKGSTTGSVITIVSSFVTLKNLTIINSGDRVDRIDSAISMKKVKKCTIENCIIKDNLYGIDMVMVNNSLFENNFIVSKNNALKLYYSSNNQFKNNIIKNSKDVTLNYSHANLFQNNKFLHNRFATHLSISNNNTFKANLYKYNSVAIMVMGAKNTTIVGNTIQSSKGAAGIGVVINGVANFTLERNILQFNAKAIYIGGQEKARGMKRYINYNEFSYNGEAIHFHATIKDNTITHNKIFGNIEDVVKDIEGNFGKLNIVEYNYWDRYAGFDRDKNNLGDTPHKIYQYADQLWHYNNKVKFFYGSPIMTLMNFLANLAPFIEPNLLLEDNKPIFN